MSTNLVCSSNTFQGRLALDAIDLLLLVINLSFNFGFIQPIDDWVFALGDVNCWKFGLRRWIGIGRRAYPVSPGYYGLF